MAEQEPQERLTDEQLAEELKRLHVSDVLVQTLFTVSSLAYHKLNPELRDLEQARLAIETMQALLPVVEPHVGNEVARDFRQVVSNLQLAYAGAVKEQAQPDE